MNEKTEQPAKKRLVEFRCTRKECMNRTVWVHEDYAGNPHSCAYNKTSPCKMTRTGNTKEL